MGFEDSYKTKRDIASVERNVLLQYAERHMQKCQSQRMQSKDKVLLTVVFNAVCRGYIHLTHTHNSPHMDCVLEV